MSISILKIFSNLKSKFYIVIIISGAHFIREETYRAGNQKEFSSLYFSIQWRESFAAVGNEIPRFPEIFATVITFI